MQIQERYINPFTDFGFKMYVLKNLHTLKDRPPKLQERIFKKLFKEAEIAPLNPREMETYQENLKAYGDQYSILETAKKEGFQEGEIVGIEKGEEIGSQKTKIELAREFKKNGVSVKLISKSTGLTEEEIEQL